MRRRQREKRRGARTLGTLLLAAVLCALLVPCVCEVAATLDNKDQSSQASQARALVKAAPEKKADTSQPLPAGRMPEQTTPIRHAPREAEKQQTVAEEPESMEPEQAVTPVEDTYFSDAVFVGDSRTEGFYLYSGLKEGQYLYSVGATVESVFSKSTQKTAAGKVPILDALAGMECSKIYLMLGVNELGWNSSQTFRDQYAKVIDRVQADHPDATVVIQSILPVSQAQENKKTYVNNTRIREYNTLLEALAEEKGCVYLDVASAVSDENGCLRADWNSDGVHLNTAGCKAWLQYLKEHPVD